MHSDSTYLRPPKRNFRRVTNRICGRPAQPVSESVDYLSLFMLSR